VSLHCTWTTGGFLVNWRYNVNMQHQHSVLIDASNQTVNRVAQELANEREGLTLCQYESPEARKKAVQAREPLFVILEAGTGSWLVRIRRVLGARPERAKTSFFFAFRNEEELRELERIGAEPYDFVVSPFKPAEVRHRMRRWVWGRSSLDPKKSKPRAVRSDEKTAPALAPLRGSLVAANGLLDAERVAKYLGVPLKTFAAGALGAKYTTVHKTPATSALTPKLEPIARVLEILSGLVGDKRSTRAWLNAPHPELGKRTPLAVILEGHAPIVADMVEGATMGLPT
jgi:hypothetical protein